VVSFASKMIGLVCMFVCPHWRMLSEAYNGVGWHFPGAGRVKDAIARKVHISISSCIGTFRFVLFSY